MSTAHWQARRLLIPAAWPVRSSPAVRPWAIISAGLAPILLTGAYLIADTLLQPGAHDHQRDGRPGRNRPVGHDRPKPRTEGRRPAKRPLSVLSGG